MTVTTELWLGFAVLVAVMLAVDMAGSSGHRPLSARRALVWSLLWVGLALAFNGAIWYLRGPEAALEFLAGYLIEKSLSVDNLFVFLMIFSFFHVPGHYQPRVLKWGILGALVLRGVFIFAGIGLLNSFHWLLYVFGALLVVTGWRMAFAGEEQIAPEKNLLVRLVRRFLPITRRIRGPQFFLRRNGVRAATPLFLTLLVVESSDVIFAIDSVPAVLAVTRDPFIVFTSNVFAILGLRALYFLLAGMLGMFAYLKLGVSMLLAFVGVKMLLAESRFAISTTFSLGVIAGILTLAILASLLVGNKKPAR